MIAGALLILSFLSPPDTTRLVPTPDGWFFTGTIGPSPVQLELRRVADDARAVEGEYFYERVGTRLSLRGTLQADGTLQLDERPPVERGAEGEPAVSGRFAGRLQRDGVALTGTWMSADGTRTLPLTLTRQATFLRLADSVRANPDTIACPGPALGIAADHGWVRFDTAPWSRLNDSLEHAARGAVAAVRAAPRDACGAEEWSRTTIMFLSPTLLSLGTNAGAFFQGAAHPNSGFAAANFVAENGAVRRVALSGLLRGDASCRARIADLLHGKLRRQEASFVDQLKEPASRTAASLDGRAVTPGRRGLDFTFSPYEVGSYAEGFYEARLTWAELGDCVPATSPLRALMPK